VYIDETYFVGALNIPNTDKDYVLQRLTSFIDTLELELLQDVLGYPLYKAFVAATGDYDPDASNASIDQKWLNILEGAEYTGRDNRLHFWKGLLFEQGTTPRSLIANYVYYYWLKDNTTQTVGIGEATAKAENSDNASPMIKMVSAWNEMSEWINDLICFIDVHQDTYTEWCSSDKWSVLRKFRKINQFGI
jgi:hypothetical protein